jgi:hypothetical protein
LEYQGHRKDSQAHHLHLADIQGFARSARETGLFMRYAAGGQVAVVNAITMGTARAEDFRSHYPVVGQQIDGWNLLATGYSESAMRFQGITHREAERATGDRSTGLPMLLSDLGRGAVDLDAITWRVENNRLEASYQLDVFNQPAFSPMVTTDLSVAAIERFWAVLSMFSTLPEVREWRAKVEGIQRLRPALSDQLDRAEITVALRGKCQHCPP